MGDTAFSECAEGRTVSVAWSCRKQFKAMQACMAVESVLFPSWHLHHTGLTLQSRMTQDRLDDAKIAFLRNRRLQEATSANE